LVILSEINHSLVRPRRSAGANVVFKLPTRERCPSRRDPGDSTVNTDRCTPPLLAETSTIRQRSAARRQTTPAGVMRTVHPADQRNKAQTTYRRR
jgi:hypothetical protein